MFNAKLTLQIKNLFYNQRGNYSGSIRFIVYLRVGKSCSPKRHILKTSHSASFRARKLVVLGLNGAGKSTLLRIMAGIDTDIEGEARPQPGLKLATCHKSQN